MLNFSLLPTLASAEVKKAHPVDPWFYAQKSNEPVFFVHITQKAFKGDKCQASKGFAAILQGITFS